MSTIVYLIEKLKQDGASFTPRVFLRAGRKGFYPDTFSLKTAQKLQTREQARRVGKRIPNPIRIRPAVLTMKVG